MKKLVIRDVCAAFLVLRGPAYYRLLSKTVEDSKLTTLGERGTTPEKTVRTILEKNPKYFRKGSIPEQYVISRKDIADDPKVVQAIKRIEESADRAVVASAAGKERIQSLQRELELEQQRNRFLQERLEQIAAICSR